MKKKFKVPSSVPSEPESKWTWQGLNIDVLKVALGHFVLTLLVYAITVSKHIHGGDSGEIAGAVHTGGLIHPPGFPLYWIFAKLIEQVPVSTVAWRLNFLSAIFAAGAASFLFVAIWRWSGAKAWAVAWAWLFSWAFAFTTLIWTYAVEAEVFSLNNFFLAGLIVFWSQWYATRSERWLSWLALWIGLAWSNHHIIVFYTLPLIAWILWEERRNLSFTRFFKWVFLVLLGMTPYLALVVNSGNVTAITWGDASSWSGFWTHFLRSEYGTFQLSAGQSEGSFIWRVLPLFAKRIAFDSLGLMVLAFALSFMATARNTGFRMIFFLWIGLSIFYYGTFSLLSNLDLTVAVHRVLASRFWQQLFVCSYFVGGLALIHFVQQRAKLAKPALGLLALLVVAQTTLAFRYIQSRPAKMMERFAELIINVLPENSLVLSQGDHITSPLRYALSVLNLRPDLRVVDLELFKTDWYVPKMRKVYPDVNFPADRVSTDINPNGFRLQTFFQSNSARRNFLCTSGPTPDPDLDKVFLRIPYGYCELFVPLGTPFMEEAASKTRKALTADLDEMEFKKLGSEEWEDAIRKHYLKSARYFSNYILEHGVKLKREDLIREGKDWIDKILVLDPKTEPEIYKNLGIAYMNLVTADPTLRPKMVEAFRKYVESKPNDPQLNQIQMIVQTGGAFINFAPAP